MQVNGYQLREAIRRAEVARLATKSKFGDALTAFPNEVKQPLEVFKELCQIEEDIALLQGAQAIYNIKVDIQSGITLSTAVKLLGGKDRLEAAWKESLPLTGRNRWFTNEGRRGKDEEVAVPTLTVDERMDEFKSAALVAARLRSMIATANATTIEIDFPEGLFTRYFDKE